MEAGKRFQQKIIHWQGAECLCSLCRLSAEWEAAKNTEAAKDAASQPAAGETAAASNSLTETYSQQVAMMPVQVPSLSMDGGSSAE